MADRLLKKKCVFNEERNIACKLKLFIINLKDISKNLQDCNQLLCLGAPDHTSVIMFIPFGILEVEAVGRQGLKHYFCYISVLS
jgi:hypothetical protein